VAAAHAAPPSHARSVRLAADGDPAQSPPDQMAKDSCFPEALALCRGSVGHRRVDDSADSRARLIRNVGVLTSIHDEMDTHLALQIFSQLWNSSQAAPVDGEPDDHADQTRLVTSGPTRRWREVAGAGNYHVESAKKVLNYCSGELERAGKYSSYYVDTAMIDRLR